VTTFHEHHLTPRHAGGSDTDDNKVRVSVVRHAMFHFARWQLYGEKGDFVAWKCLTGQLEGSELQAERGRMGQKKTLELREQRKVEDPSFAESETKWLTEAGEKGRRTSKTLRETDEDWRRKEVGRMHKAKEVQTRKWYEDENYRKKETERLGKLGSTYGHLGGKATKGKKWWHNPSTGKKTMSFTCPGEGWLRGGGKFHRKKNLD
jgi:hypothetical protein